MVASAAALEPLQKIIKMVLLVISILIGRRMFGAVE